MIRSSQQCDSARLKNLLEKALSEPDERAVIEHLSTCTSCQRELEVAAGDANWWNELRVHLADGLPGDLSGGSSIDDAESSLSDASDTGIGLVLAPSDDPRMLGRIGLYEVAGIIGRGSTGIVFKAFEPSLNRYVAIKVLAPELAHNSAARKRFAREARAAAAVTHEHIVPIHAVSEFQGLPYIVMQYVPGHSLQQRIDREGPLGLLETVRIALQTSRALAAAHQQGLVHRDIKPANILLNVGVEHALVTDFGLARVADDASLTHSGSISGTPQYMSPEQARGESAGPRSDLFSLGSVLYAMCTGHSPFRAETVLGVIHRVCDSEQRPLREVNPEVPPWLDQFTAKLLSKYSHDRFRDAAEVATLLEEELAHLQHPTAIPEPKRAWLTDRAKRFTPTAGVIVACLSLLLLAILIGTVGTVELPTETARQPVVAAEREQTTEWGDTTIRWDLTEGDKKRSTITRLDDNPQRFLLGVKTTAGNQHALVLERDEQDRCSLRIGQDVSSDDELRSQELIDDIFLDKARVTTPFGSFCVHAEGIKNWSNSSSTSTSSHATSSSSGAPPSTTSSQKKVTISKSGTTNYAIGYAVTPWKGNDGEPIEISCRARNGKSLSIDFKGDPSLCEIKIHGVNRETIHTMTLKPGGLLEVDGKRERLDGSRLSVNDTGNSIVLSADSKKIFVLKGK